MSALGEDTSSVPNRASAYLSGIGEGCARSGKEDNTPEIHHPRRDTGQIPVMKNPGGAD